MNNTTKFALSVELKAKAGKASEVEAFLKKEATFAKEEPGTISWHAANDEGEPETYVIFDTFKDEAGRDAHLNGPAAKELQERASALFSEVKVRKLRVIAQK